MTYVAHYHSPLGLITLASNGDALTGLWFEGQKYFGAGMETAREEKALSVFAETKRWLDLYFQGMIPDFTPLLHFEGSAFRKSVWERLLLIPYGKTVTYGDLAGQIAKKMSAQAVGGAVGHNPIAIIVPCHRVVGANGSLIGYAGGIDKKEKLLALEKKEV
ncbi:MAG: methylated-DNA--[Clostridia bacterium]|nr:methylated-DNA--[protein]-cysteine S-methyltransferase [Clostridia bacterium]